VSVVTPYAALRRRTGESPAAPLVTYVDPESGVRMELSATSLDNAVAKTAGLLRDELDVSPGDRIAIHLPWHWQRAVWLGACAATETVFAADAAPVDCAVCVMDRDHLDQSGGAGEDVLVSLDPFGLPDGGPIPPGVTEAAVAMRSHPDRFNAYVEPRGDVPLLAIGGGVVTSDAVMEMGHHLAQVRGLAPGARVAVLPDDPDRDILLLAVPLALHGSVVLLGRETPQVPRLLLDEGAVLTKESP